MQTTESWERGRRERNARRVEEARRQAERDEEDWVFLKGSLVAAVASVATEAVKWNILF